MGGQIMTHTIKSMIVKIYIKCLSQKYLSTDLKSIKNTKLRCKVNKISDLKFSLV